MSRVASTLEQQALQPLQVYMQADLDKRFRGLVQDGRRLIKDYVTARNTLLKTRDKYYRCVCVCVHACVCLHACVCVCVHMCVCLCLSGVCVCVSAHSHRAFSGQLGICLVNVSLCLTKLILAAILM